MGKIGERRGEAYVMGMRLRSCRSLAQTWFPLIGAPTNLLYRQSLAAVTTAQPGLRPHRHKRLTRTRKKPYQTPQSSHL